MQKGTIAVQTENIFPIIKRFLYSDQEIFLRELISNAVDATTKLQTLAKRGEAKGEIGDTTIEIILNNESNTLTIRDKGIGMNEEEVMKYLNQVAFSSAQEFIDKYKEDSNLIGHFGLGFYSAFMVADKVDVITRSYREGEAAVKWSCDGSPEYTLEAVEKPERGTDIILHIGKESDEYLEKNRIQELLDKYCKFLPVPIRFGTRTETKYEGEGDDEKPVSTEVDNIVNNPNPAWKKQPSELTDEDYLAFYEELYPYSAKPLFWIHLNIDYPFNLTGILYFPKLNNSMEVQKNKVHLYCNQVYVTDDVRDILPEFLTLLHGVIDSPDIPLNVSRSYLQGDREVKKITGHISKKVADKLQDLFKKDRPAFESKWNDIGMFIKYGMFSDEKFHERAMTFALLRNTEDAYFTIEEYKEKIKPSQTDKNNKTVVIYTNNPVHHDSFVKAAKSKGYDVLVFDTFIDNHFMQHLEYKTGDLVFVRVDSETTDNLVQKDEKMESVLNEAEENQIKQVFEGLTGTKSMATVAVKALSPEEPPVVITKPEFMRRFKEMQALQGGMNGLGDFPESYNVVVNANHPLVATKLLQLEEDAKAGFAKYLYDLALLNQGMLTGPELTSFVQQSLEYVK